MITFGNILGGVNYTIPPNELPQYYLADAQNIVPILNGYAAPRNGSAKLNSTATGDPIKSFHEFNGAQFANYGTVIGKYSAGSFSNHITGLTDAYGQWWNYGDYAIYVNGVDNPQKTDGTTGNDLTADMSGLTGGRSVCEWGERLWIPVGAQLNGSALRAPTDWSTATVDIGYYQGYVGNKEQNINTVIPFYDILLIGKLNQVYQLTGAPETASSTFRLTPVQTKDKDSFGFTAKNAWALVGNDLLFLDGFSIKSLAGVTQYGDFATVSIVGNIKDFLREGAGISKTHLSYTHFFHYKHKEQIYVSIPTGSLTRYWFVIDYSNQEIRQALELPKYSFYPMSASFVPLCFGGIEDGSKVLPYCGCEDGYVRRLDYGINDTSTAVDSYMTWCWGHQDRNIQPKYVDLNMVYDAALTLQLSYALGLTDWEQIRTASNYNLLGYETVTSATWRRENNWAYKRIASFMYNTGKSFALKLRHHTSSESFEMRSSSFGYKLKHKYAG